MACTTILVGKDASFDGSTIIARNEDSPSGVFCAKNFTVVTPDKQPKHYKSVLSHVEIDLPDNPMRYTSVPNAIDDEGIWGAAGVNEANVAMTATETITSNERVLGADPLVEYKKAQGKPGDADYEPEVIGGIGEEDMVTLVLPYIKSAREGVERLGALLEKYGTYEMNGIAFSDCNEIWWLETIGGHHWIAVRVPDDAYVTMPNQLGIDAFDLTDALTSAQENMCSSDFKNWMEEYHLNVEFEEDCVCSSTCDCDCSCGSDCDCAAPCGCDSDCTCGCQEGAACTCACSDKGEDCACGSDCDCDCAAACGCDSDCTCGCQEGAACTCACSDKGEDCACGSDCSCGDECDCEKAGNACGCAAACGCDSDCTCGCQDDEGAHIIINPRLSFGSRSDADHVYNTPRAWAMHRFFYPEYFDGPHAQWGPESDDIPFSMAAPHKITMEDVKYLLSLHYQGTDYDPYSKRAPKSTRGKYRPIGINRNSELAAIQLRGWAPKAVQAIQWMAYGSNTFNALVPFYANVNTTPAYLNNTGAIATSESFYWANRLIAALCDPHFNTCSNHIEHYQEAVGSFGWRLINEIDRKVVREGISYQDAAKLLEDANEKMSARLKKETDKTLTQVLYTASLDMKNGFAMSDH